MTEEDIWNVLKDIAETAGQIGMTRDDLEKSHNLVERYGSERDKLFEDMLSRLDQYDTSNLRGYWSSDSETGRGLIERLDSDVPKSPSGEGLKAIGASYFADGEKKIWQANYNSDVPMVADVINKIYNADLELIKKCEEDLKTCRDGDAIVEEILRQCQDGILSGVLALGKKFGEKKLVGAFLSWMNEDAKPFAEKAIEEILKKFDEFKKEGRDKAVLKKLLLSNIELIRQTEAQLSEKWIDEMYQKGAGFATSFFNVGQYGNYKAEDWKKFGEECATKLAERRDRAKEQSRKVFGELLPTFLDEGNRAFAALTDDPYKLSAWKEDMKAAFKSIDDLLEEENTALNELTPGPYLEAARETYNYFRDTITMSVKLWLSSTQEAEDSLKV